MALSSEVKILLAEDNAVNTKLIIALLTRKGWQVDSVTNGGDALKKAQEQYFDVILMDGEMPEMNGFEATVAIRKFEAEHDSGYTPIIALTANSMEEDRDRYFEAGMNDYISKPFRQEELYETILRTINKYNKR